MQYTVEMRNRGLHTKSSRMILVGMCAWISVCLLIAGWLPEVNSNVSSLWLVSGLLGLISAVGLAETIKSDMRLQESLMNEYIHAASTDALTGLANRHALDRMVSDALRECLHRRRPLSMIMLDIDHFKAFNDQWGHQAGDAVLRCVSRKLGEFFQEQGFPARYGGEEFAVVLPMTRLMDADRLADACRAAIKETACQYRDKVFQVTISCGVTESQNSDSAETLMQRADLALYTAKKMGRDCIWVADPSQPETLCHSVFQPAPPMPPVKFSESQTVAAGR